MLDTAFSAAFKRAAGQSPGRFRALDGSEPWTVQSPSTNHRGGIEPEIRTAPCARKPAYSSHCCTPDSRRQMTCACRSEAAVGTRLPSCKLTRQLARPDATCLRVPGFVRMYNRIVQMFNAAMAASPQRTSASARPPVRRARAATSDAARPDRRLAILLAAEKLFAQHGYHAVTIRDIADEAGVPLALVGYYFGPKHELFGAIFEHWSHTIEERLAGLRAIPNDPTDSRTLPLIIEAFIAPVLALRASPEGEYYAVLVARELGNATEEADRVMRTYFDPLAIAYIDALHIALPHATRGEVAWGYQFA